MTFQKLEIEAIQYGDNKGKLIAEISIRGDKSRTTMELPQLVADKILQLAKKRDHRRRRKSRERFHF